MKIVVFAKKRNKLDGGIFYNYLSTLTNTKTGEVVTVQVKFRQECGMPDPHKCPRVIEFDKKAANMTKHSYTTEDGETRTRSELWVSSWKDAGDYVDNSLDDFD